MQGTEEGMNKVQMVSEAAAAAAAALTVWASFILQHSSAPCIC